MTRDKIGFKPTDILIPDGQNMERWSVVACDQYTSQPEYWKRVRKSIGLSPSTLHMIIPEAELKTAEPEAVNRTMVQYLENGIFRTLPQSLVFVRRTQSDGKVRDGLLGALDLECYDYHSGALSLCRATEGTVLDRLPPRIKVREGAALELPHIMVLIDDPKRSVIEPLADRTEKFEKIYDFSLMENSGHLKGYAVSSDQAAPVLDALAALAGNERDPLLYAVGDGNHSLATAKCIYEDLKVKLGREAEHHPARYCLVELVNIHSEALKFEPIHRIVYHADQTDLVDFLSKAGLEAGGAHYQKLEMVVGGVPHTCSFYHETAELTVGTLQNALDAYLSSHPKVTIDYIHGGDVVIDLTKKEGAIGFLLPEMKKEEFFHTVICDGALPRKTFSMGHAQDKRFYLECRKIH